MTAGERAGRLWELFSTAFVSGDRVSREQALDRLGCTDGELDEAIEVVVRAVDNTRRSIQQQQAQQWVPFAERKPSKEIRRLIAYG